MTNPTSEAFHFDHIAAQTDLIFTGVEPSIAPLDNLHWAALNCESSAMGKSLEQLVCLLAWRLPLVVRGLVLQAARRLRDGDVNRAEHLLDEAGRYTKGISVSFLLTL